MEQYVGFISIPAAVCVTPRYSYLLQNRMINGEASYRSVVLIQVEASLLIVSVCHIYGFLSELNYSPELWRWKEEKKNLASRFIYTYSH